MSPKLPTTVQEKCGQMINMYIQIWEFKKIYIITVHASTESQINIYIPGYYKIGCLYIVIKHS